MSNLDLIKIYLDEKNKIGASFWNAEIEKLSNHDMFNILDLLLRWQKELSSYMYGRLNDYSNRYLKPIESKENTEQINTNFKILLDKFNKLEKQLKEVKDEPQS